MRFRFLGGQDCPDWLLCQIASFSQLSSIKFKRLCDLSVTDHLLNGDTEEEKLSAFFTQDIDSVKVHRFIVAIAYILRKTVGYKCSAEDLETEATQIGLPLEHSKILAKSLTKHYPAIDSFIMKNIPKEAVFTVSSLRTSQSPISLEYTKSDVSTNCIIPPAKFSSFVKEMEEVLQLVKQRFD